jgi:DnaJ-class molecular chaperone
MNPYTVLGISNTTEKKEIKRAYRKLASIHHPDKGGDTEKYQEIQNAYDMLKDITTNKPKELTLRPVKSWLKTFSFSNERPNTYYINLSVTQLYNGGVIEAGNGLKIIIPLGLRIGDTRYVDEDECTVTLRDEAIKNLYFLKNHKLILPVAVPMFAAIIGTEVTFKHLDEKSYKLRIPANTTDGDVLQMKGLGMFNDYSGERDSLFIQIVTDAPEIKDKEVIDLLERKGYYSHSYSL